MGDFNGDGRIEVAAGTEDGEIRILATGDGKQIARFSAGGSILTFGTGDLDGDSVLELIAAEENGQIIALKM